MKIKTKKALLNTLVASALVTPMAYAQTLHVDPNDVVPPEGDILIVDEDGDTLFVEDNRNLDTAGVNFLCNQESIAAVSLDVQVTPGLGNSVFSVTVTMTHAKDQVEVYDDEDGTYIWLSNASVPHMTCGPYVFQRDEQGKIAEDAGVYVYLNEGDDKYDGTGSDTPQFIYGGDNDDTIYGGMGNDEIYGEEGNDKIYGKKGDDTIWGGDDGDFIKGNEGNDYINGGLGNDKLYGGWGSDKIYGDYGDDIMEGNQNSDILIDCQDNDYDTFDGGGGADMIIKVWGIILNEDPNDLKHNISVPICISDL